TPVAVRLLDFFAFLDPEDISLELLRHAVDPLTAKNGVAEKDWERFVSLERPLTDVLNEALKALLTYSLIQWKEEQAGYSMHKLVHAWGFGWLEAEEQRRHSQSSLALSEVVIQDDQLNPMRKSRITPHISSSVARLREWHKG
ncbi:hypothetical protein LTR78_010962, partial [Recurvomyces mirabilis]